MLFKALAVAAAITGAVAQRPTNTSICDYYTTALLTNNTATNQKTLLTLVVNTAVIGNYTTPNVGIMVPGILTAGEYKGTAVNLLPYFDGALMSSDAGGLSGVSVNFLDGGGAAPLMKNMPANGTTSNQYILLTHLYSYFGDLLGCTLEGTGDYPAYSGDKSMYETHKFMDLNAAEVGYFITQVGLSASSFGVADADVTIVGNALTSLFDYRCAPATTVIPAQGSHLQSICTNSDCPLAVNSTCSAYQSNITEPTNTTSGTSSSTTGMPSSTMTGTGSALGASLSLVVAAGAFAAFLL